MTQQITPPASTLDATAHETNVPQNRSPSENQNNQPRLGVSPARIPQTRERQSRAGTSGTTLQTRTGLQSINSSPLNHAHHDLSHVSVQPQLASRNDVPMTWTPPIKDIFCTRTPILRHIPTRARSTVLRSFTACVWDAVRATHETSRECAFMRLFMFAHCVLRTIPKKTAKHLRSSNIEIIRERVHDWEEGKLYELWQEAIRAAKSRKHKSHFTKPQRELNLRRAVRLAHDGAIGKAASALASNGVHEATAAVQQTLLTQHPQKMPAHESRNNSPMPTQRHLSLIDTVKPEDITGCMKKFPRAICRWWFRA